MKKRSAAYNDGQSCTDHTRSTLAGNSNP